MNPTFNFKASSAPMWADCSLRAMETSLGRIAESKAINIGIHVGNCVHAAITGHEHTKPASFSFDEQTRTQKEMERQIKDMSAQAKTRLDELKLKVIKTEIRLAVKVGIGEAFLNIEGHIDMVCKNEESSELVLVDLKTGKNPPRGSWPQMAMYSWLWKQTQKEQADKCLLLWIPRWAKPKTIKQDVWFRSCDSLMEFADGMVRNVMAAHTRGAVPNPSSLSCSSCQVVDCPVRL